MEKINKVLVLGGFLLLQGCGVGVLLYSETPTDGEVCQINVFNLTGEEEE